MQVTQYDAGVFNWVDLQTTDLDAAKKFYTEMFGWSFEDSEVPGGGVYRMASLGGKSVCGMSTLPPGDVPPHWNTYVSVADVEQVAGKVEGLGGTVVAPPFDVVDAGRMAVLQDPAGAAISLWQPFAHIGAQVANEPNSFCWNELYTNNLGDAGEFYGRLFGWEFEKLDHPSFPLHSIRMGRREIGTMIEIQSEWGSMPPHWAVYFAVGNCDESLAQARALGGSAFIEPADIPEVGRFAGVVDPQGAHLMIIQLASHAAGAQT